MYRGIAKYFYIPLLANLWLSCASARELVIAYGQYDVAPFAITENNRLTGGIIKDLGTALAAELGLKPVFLDIPRKRMPEYVASGKAHLRIVMNPQWIDNPDQYSWSDVLFHDRDIVVIRKESRDETKTLSDLKDLRIGTILGHKYPGIEHLFADNLSQRDDSSNLITNLERLSKKRIDAVVTSQLSYDFYRKTHGDSDDYAVLDWFPGNNELFAMFSKNLPINTSKVLEACNVLKTKGIISGILKAYKSDPDNEFNLIGQISPSTDLNFSFYIYQ